MTTSENSECSSCALSFESSEKFEETSKLFLEHSDELLLQNAQSVTPKMLYASRESLGTFLKTKTRLNLDDKTNGQILIH